MCSKHQYKTAEKHGEKKGGGKELCLALSSDVKHMYDTSQTVCLTDSSHAAEMVYRHHRDSLMRQGANKVKHCNSTEQDEQPVWYGKYVVNSHATSKHVYSAFLWFPGAFSTVF